MTSKTRVIMGWVLPAAVLIGAVATYCLSDSVAEFLDRAMALMDNGEKARLQEWIEGYGLLGPGVIIAMMLLQTLVPVIPSLLPLLAAVVAYGAVAGSVLAWFGLLLSAALGYWIGMLLGPATVDKIIGEDTHEKIEHAVNRYGIWAVIAARVSPLLSTDAISIFAGLVRMRFLQFMGATAVGTAALVLLVGILGTDFDRLETGLWWLGGLTGVALIAWVAWDYFFHWRRKTGSPA